MLKRMIPSKYLKKIIFLSLFIINFYTYSLSEIMILSSCSNDKNGFIKNEYVLDLEKSLMTREYIYDNKTYKKHRVTDLSIKKENFISGFIYEVDGLILTDKIGYPQFYTQLIFERNNHNIRIKTVINNEIARI